MPLINIEDIDVSENKLALEAIQKFYFDHDDRISRKRNKQLNNQSDFLNNIFDITQFLLFFGQ